MQLKLGRTANIQAGIWYRQGRPHGAKSEALVPLEIYLALGATEDAENCRDLLGRAEEAMKS